MNFDFNIKRPISKEDREEIIENMVGQILVFAESFMEKTGKTEIHANDFGTFCAGIVWGMAKCGVDQEEAGKMALEAKKKVEEMLNEEENILSKDHE